MIETAVLRLCGHRSIGPADVVDQSKAQVSSPISPPPISQSGAAPATRRDVVRLMEPARLFPDGLRIAVPSMSFEFQRVARRLAQPLAQLVDLLLQLDHP